MADFGGIGGVFSSAGGAISDFFAAEGDKKSAQNYAQAADIADQNAQLAKMSTAIQQAAEQRQLFKVVGGQAADVAGAGLANSGSAIDIMKDSTRQGALTQALTGIQGTINENAYLAQAGAYRGEQQAAETAAKAAQGGGIMSTLGTVAGIAAMFL